jgi:hypothetical protein
MSTRRIKVKFILVIFFLFSFISAKAKDNDKKDTEYIDIIENEVKCA